jgi:hypothetical protein
VELMAFPGFEGRDLSTRVNAAGLGILSLQFPVSDLDAWLAKLAERGVPLIKGPAVMPMPPFGMTRAATIATPDGAWLTFFQLFTAD